MAVELEEEEEKEGGGGGGGEDVLSDIMAAEPPWPLSSFSMTAGQAAVR